jgi:hypothetical protein
MNNGPAHLRAETPPLNPPNPASQKPRRHPLHPKQNRAQPGDQQKPNHPAQKPTRTPPTNLTPQVAKHDRKIQMRGGGCR